jgi:hypothetical protein
MLFDLKILKTTIEQIEEEEDPRSSSLGRY